MLKSIKVAIFAIALSSAPALAQVATPGIPLVPLGYCQLTSIDTAVAVSTCSGGIPAGATMAIIAAEAQAVRYRDDGVTPTATVGMPLAVGPGILYVGRLLALQVISQTGGAKLDILFYR